MPRSRGVSKDAGGNECLRLVVSSRIVVSRCLPLMIGSHRNGPQEEPFETTSMQLQPLKGNFCRGNR
jgi:hypothetical protein